MSRADALTIIDAAISAVKPTHFIPQQLKRVEGRIDVAGHSYSISNDNRLFVASVGKAAAAMALEVEKIAGEKIYRGLVITKYGHTLPLRHFRTIEAGHPLPDANSVIAADMLADLFREASASDTILFLVSGGASALIADLPESCTLPDLSNTVKLLLDCGANIEEMNTVRKHLSTLKGGQLMRYTKARVHALLLSDVPGDDLSIIASGLTVADNSSFADAWNVLERYHLTHQLPAAVWQWLSDGLNGQIADTPKAHDPIFGNVCNTLVATNARALEAAATTATQLGYQTTIMPNLLRGDAALQAEQFVQQLHMETGDKICLLWGGETTVVVKGDGKGGRNQHFALAALQGMVRNEEMINGDMIVAAAGTDGTDGPTDATGAIADDAVIDQARKLQLDMNKYLSNNDAFHFFEKTRGHIVTGPTQTNVMDVIVGLRIRT